jgi:hypothetical protein
MQYHLYTPDGMHIEQSTGLVQVIKYVLKTG